MTEDRRALLDIVRALESIASSLAAIEAHLEEISNNLDGAIQPSPGDDRYHLRVEVLR